MNESYLLLRAAVSRRINDLVVTEGLAPSEANNLLAAAVDVLFWQKACTLEEMLEYIKEWRPASC